MYVTAEWKYKNIADVFEVAESLLAEGTWQLEISGKRIAISF